MNMKSKRVAFLILLLVIVVNVASAQQLKITHINVGQGDSTLIISPTGKTTLIDAGNTGKGNNTVRPYLASLGIAHLDYVAASHYDADHIGGMDEVVNGQGASKIGSALDRGTSPNLPTTAAYTDYASAVAGHRVTMTPGSTIYLGGGVWMKCVAADGNVLNYGYVSGATGDENDMSLGWVIYYGAFKYYTGGDLGGAYSSDHKDMETHVAPCVGTVDAMKVGHHGSSYSTNQYFVDTLYPAAAVISCGSNSYGHPVQQTLDRLAAAGCDIYQTATGSGGTIPAGCGWIANSNIVLSTTGSSDFTMSFGSTTNTYPLHTHEITPGAVRSLPTSLAVALTGYRVTAPFADHFYIETTDRTSAIRVNSTANPPLNSVTNVLGAVSQSLTAEDAVNASDVFVITDAPAGTIKPFGVSTRSINGEPYNSTWVDGRVGPSNAALLVKTWGSVLGQPAPASGVFYIDDGSGYPVRIASAKSVAIGDYVSVVGIVGFRANAGKPERFIEARSADDVVKLR